MDETPRFIPHDDMKRLFDKVEAKWALVLVRDRIYKRESDGWHLLDQGVTRGS